MHSDGSATWVMEQRFLLETKEEEDMFRKYSDWRYFSNHFIQNVTSLVNEAKLRTGREDMAVPLESFKLTISGSGSYKVIRYRFEWIEFADSTGGQIIIGDVFEVEGLFLLGDGILDITVSSGYVIESVSPPGDADSGIDLRWNNVTNLESGEPEVVLRQRAFGVGAILREHAIMIISVILVLGIGSFSVWYFRFGKKAEKRVKGVAQPPEVQFELQDDEEKVVDLLRATGGRLYQSTVAERLEFSRSKTSKLLTSMEKEGRIRREKKGRQKVVILTNETRD
ncbi:hypothetical protein GWN43_06260 [Candidatus Bathyarchaeota archaeon]|nr:hypothetical protein [Candidatus Bathyarchaeota archaeon]